MAAWNKVKFFYETMLGSNGSTLTASSTAPGDSVDNIYNMLEVNKWKQADAVSPCYITYDAGAGNTKTADYLVILGHNLKDAGATITLQYSSDNAVWNDCFVGVAVSVNTILLKEFSSPGAYRYWRLKISGHTIAPFMAICIWGNKTELDQASPSFAPDAQETNAVVSRSNRGYVTGIFERFTDRIMNLRFEDADSALYAKVKTWHETNGLKQFFIAWENANNPGDVFLMYPDPRFNNPFKYGGLWRDITISLKGRKE